jgi:hypothetical protein
MRAVAGDVVVIITSISISISIIVTASAGCWYPLLTVASESRVLKCGVKGEYVCVVICCVDDCDLDGAEAPSIVLYASPTSSTSSRYDNQYSFVVWPGWYNQAVGAGGWGYPGMLKYRLERRR